jgi:hypothetical protein
VQQGVMVDLKNLDQDVSSLCTKVLALPPAEARELQPLMADMIAALEELGLALSDYRDRKSQ